MKLSVIIISYNTQDLTVATLDSVWQDLQQAPALLKDTEILVVDNHSEDESVAAIKKWFKLHAIAHRLIANAQNTGFAKANNQAIAQATGEYLWLLNSDTVVQPGAIKTLVATFDQHALDDTTAAVAGSELVADRLGILTPQLLNVDGTVQRQGGDLPSLLSLMGQWWWLASLPLVNRFWPSTQHTGSYRQHPDQQRLHLKGWVAGTAMLLRRQVIVECGDLDEQIFMYGEDMELCLRARAHHWDIAEVSAAKVLHYGSASSSSAKAIAGEVAGYLHIWKKHKPSWQMPAVKAILKFGILLRWLLFGTMKRYKSRADVYRRLWTTI